MPEKTREELLEYLKTCNPRTRNTFIQMIEGKVSENDSAAFVREKLSFMEQDLTPREVTFVSSRLCDCGKLISQNNALQGKCQHRGCRRYVCAECARTCCGRTLCPRHYTESRSGKVHCRRCRPVALLKAFFDIGNDNERAEK
jgi:hypothetical protein